MSMQKVYTDGSCSPNPGPGGWAFIIDDGDAKIEVIGSHAKTTNNRMEMMAAIQALEFFDDVTTVTIYSDSQYLVNGMKSWIYSWRKKNYKKKGKLIPNADLWVILWDLNVKHRVRWHWVKGHNGHAGNERADELAEIARETQA